MDGHLCRALVPIWEALWSLIGAKRSQETRRRREAARRGDEWNVWPEYLWRDFPGYPRLCKFIILMNLILAYPGICKFWKLILAYPGLCKSSHRHLTYSGLSWDIPIYKSCPGISWDILTSPACRFARSSTTAPSAKWGHWGVRNLRHFA